MFGFTEQYNVRNTVVVGHFNGQFYMIVDINLSNVSQIDGSKGCLHLSII